MMFILAALTVCSAILTVPASAHDTGRAPMRTALDRQAAVARIAKFAGVSDADVRYERAGKSSYNANVPIELYLVGQDQFEINIQTNEIIQTGPGPRAEGVAPKARRNEALYSKATLEAKARALVATQTKVSLDALTANHTEKTITAAASNKPDTHAETAGTLVVYYFFRWEDRTRTIEGLPAFVQVGFSGAGDLLSYTNTLGLGSGRSSAAVVAPRRDTQAPLALTGPYYYANGGGYYSWGGPTASRYFAGNQGYCYFAGWCNPKNMEWTTSTYSIVVNSATWDNINTSGQDGTLKVYIPCVHAGTRRARYEITYQGYTTRDVDQSPYCNTWVQIAYLRDIQFVRLTDLTEESTSTEIGFDEIQIIY